MPSVRIFPRSIPWSRQFCLESFDRIHQLSSQRMDFFFSNQRSLRIFSLKLSKLQTGKSDPYVKFNLEKDNFGPFDKGYGKMESTKNRDELNPTYGETFTFDDIPDLNDMVLQVTIKDDDIAIDENIGSCKFKLEELGLSSDPMEVDKIVDRKGFGLLRKHAKIYMKLSWTE